MILTGFIGLVNTPERFISLEVFANHLLLIDIIYKIYVVWQERL